jgi:superfamily II DNA/RNA helicase
MTKAQKTFSQFGLDPRILSAISAMGYVSPTPIQEKAIPLVLSGVDVMGAAQTGTGKTAGYGLLVLQRVLPQANTSASPARHPVRVLVLTPTRELADQVNENLVKYASETPLRVGVVYGGVDMKPQTEQLRRGVEVLTATPGRLLDHVESKSVTLSRVEVVVLDEADRMLDMGFLPDISRILNLLPKTRQSLMFSATFSPEIKKLAKNFLADSPAIVEVARQNSTADTVEQIVYSLHDSEKTDALIQILQTGEDGDPLKQVLVFVNAKITCRRLARTLQRSGIKADAIHGDKTQDERTAALNAFKSGECEVLVATDVAARGLDIAELPTVINYDVPFQAEDYVHRIGRTGRAGAKGKAIMLTTGADSRSVSAIEHLIRKKFEPQVFELVRKPRREDRDRGSFRHPSRFRDEDHEGRSKPDLGEFRRVAYDPIFDKPYEPGESPAPARDPQPAAVRTSKPKRPVAALLGGGFRK